MIALATQTCAHHPGRLGHALCMTCRKVVCQECATTWEGVNHCRPCMAKRRAAAEERHPAGEWIVWLAASGFLFAIASWAMAWSAALWARVL